MVFNTIRLDEIIKGHYVAIAEKGTRFKPWSTLQLKIRLGGIPEEIYH